MRGNIRNILAVALVISVSVTAMVYAGGAAGRRGPGGRFADQLTEEQREAIHVMVMEMREAGASREDIDAAVRETMESFDVALPDVPREGRPEGGPKGNGPGGPFGDRLTEEQREAIHAMVKEMREAGASREDIHAAVRDMFAEFGIDLPECPEGGEASSQAENLGESPGEGKRWGEIKGRFE